MSREYDAVVVGARCAGSPVAMLLARRGYRVLLVDEARFPSDMWIIPGRWYAREQRPVGNIERH